MNLVKYIGSQFSNPRGFGGKLSTYFMNRLNQKQYNKVIELFQDRKPESVLDIGFGNGYLLEKLSQDSETCFYGIELSDTMVSEAKKRNINKVENKKMWLSKGDVLDLKFEDESFDFMYTVNTVYFWVKFQKGYSEIYRTLKPGGVFANLFYTKEWLDKLKYTKYDFKKYSKDELVDLVAGIGFSKVELVELKKDCAYCLLTWK
jgi:ubiquinone/menaquinone biosynthesis C-methylase UbiE